MIGTSDSVGGRDVWAHLGGNWPELIGDDEWFPMLLST